MAMKDSLTEQIGVARWKLETARDQLEASSGERQVLAALVAVAHAQVDLSLLILTALEDSE